MILELTKIRTDGGTQMRTSLDHDVIESYAESMRSNDKFPHLTVFFDGEHHWLADGFHRLEAMKILGKDVAVVDAIQGSLREAILFAVGANAKHGLRRSREDKQRAIKLLLHDAEWGKKSDRWIAERCGVHHEIVRRLRNAPDQLAQSASCERKGRDGRTRRLPKKDAGDSIEPTGAENRNADLFTAASTEDELGTGFTKSTARESASAEDNADSDSWIDETVRRVLRAPFEQVESLKIRIENAFAARGLYFGGG